MVQRAQGEASPGQVSYPQEVEGWSEVSTHIFLYIGLLVQTTSSNASKAVPFSKSDWTLSCHRTNSASKKVVSLPQLLSKMLLAH